MLTAFDVLLISVAIIILWVGLRKRMSLRKTGRHEDRQGALGGLIGYLVGHRQILRNPFSGTAHVLLFWGVVIPLLVIILSQFPLTMPKVPSQILSLVTDVLGIALLIGVLFFLIRRIRSRDPVKPKKALFPILVLLFVLLTGFLAEGTRLSIMSSGLTWASPVG